MKDMRIFNAIFPKKGRARDIFAWHSGSTALAVTVDWEQEGKRLLKWHLSLLNIHF